MSDFDAARRRAVVRRFLALLMGDETRLLPFEEIQERLHLRHFVDRGRQDVPLDLIVGSVGRSMEFDRLFLPKHEASRRRWEDIDRLAESSAGFPPVDLYKVGEAYFVVDGHHRVSVARSIEAPAIEAWVKEFRSPIPLGPDDSLEDVIGKQGLLDFLEATGLGATRRGEFELTVPGGYDRLLEHIAVHRYFKSIERSAEFPWPEAVASWRDEVYRPAVAVVRDSGVMEEFPDRTEGDLYLFLMDRVHALRQEYGASPGDTEAAAEDLKRQHRNGKQSVAAPATSEREEE